MTTNLITPPKHFVPTEKVLRPGSVQGRGSLPLSKIGAGAGGRSFDLEVIQFSLPPDLEAREPPEARGLRRDEVRLLVTAQDGSLISHSRFADLPNFLRPGDLVIANDSATLPAALDGWRLDGTPILLHLSTRLDEDLWVVEPRKVEMTPGEIVDLPDGGIVTFLSPYAGSQRLWLAYFDLPMPVLDYLETWGRPITYGYIGDRWPLEMYQTVYAHEPGSAEMPSAGRAFSNRVLNRLAERGVGFATITLHTGVSSLEGHEAPYAERYAVPPATADAIHHARENGGRTIAAGTTVVRALESSVDEQGGVVAQSGWSDLVITPERGVRVIDALLTGLHEAESSHLAMLEAVASRLHLERAYEAALGGRYLWHEFGDLHLILP
jgi:S-adenosylmethionine:tRNA ribosyltransferase-isomerase